MNASARNTSYNFSAFLENAKYLHSALKAINFQDSATFYASEQGLKLTVEQNKCVQASAYIPRENFWEFSISDTEMVEFKINLNVLTECLNIFGSGEESNLKIYYKQQGAPLILVLENKSKDNSCPDDQITDCEIKTQEADDLINFNNDAVTHTMIVLKAAPFLNILNDLEKSSDVLEFNITPHGSSINLIIKGGECMCAIEIAKTSSIVFSFSCSSEVNFKYKCAQIRLITKALSISTKVAIKINSEGLLSIQNMIEREENKQMYIEFFIMPLIDDDDVD